MSYKQPMVLLYMVLEGLAHEPCERPLKNPWFYCTWFRRALQMVLRPRARPPKQPMVLGGRGFKTMYRGDVVMLVTNKIKNIIHQP